MGGKKRDAIDDFIAGAVAGAFSRMVIAPLDVIKIRFQVQNEARVAYQYRSVASAFREIVRDEGLSALWKGNVPALLMVVPYAAIQFATYYGIKTSQVLKWGGTANSLIMGGIAGASATVCTYPLDLLRTRLAAQPEPKKYNGVMHATKMIMREEGFTGIYAGLTPTLVEIVPYIALSFAFYEAGKDSWLKRTESRELSPVESTIIGGIAGTISKFAILPLDNVKKRMQVETQFGSRRYTGIWHALTSVARSDGMKGLFRGAVPSLVKAAPYTGITFASFEFTKRSLARLRSAESHEHL